jgi:hypothetical protein
MKKTVAKKTNKKSVKTLKSKSSVAPKGLVVGSNWFERRLHRPYLWAAICGILSPIFFIIFYILSISFDLSHLAFDSLVLLVAFTGFIYFYGFYYIGKRYKNSLVKVMTLIFLVFYFLYFSFFIYVDAYVNAAPYNGTDELNLTTPDDSDLYVYVGVFGFIGLWYVFLCVCVFLFGVGLFTMRKRIAYSGFLGAVVMFSAFFLFSLWAAIFVAILVLIAYIVSLVMFFSLDRKTRQ